MPAAFGVWGVVFADRLPVQAVPGNFLGQYPFAPSLVDCRVEQGIRVDGKALHPPTIDLHCPHVKRLSGCQCLPDDPFRLFPRGRVVGFSRHVDGQRVQPGFLPGYGFYQLRGWLRLRRECGSVQTEQRRKNKCLFHGVHTS